MSCNVIVAFVFTSVIEFGSRSSVCILDVKNFRILKGLLARRKYFGGYLGNFCLLLRLRGEFRPGKLLYQGPLYRVGI
jgi:hypothetical protein